MTTDHTDLRAAVELHAKLKGGALLTIKFLDLAELLAAYDALAGAGKKSAKSGTYSPEFEEAWSEYPARPGNSKAAAYKAWKARLTAGATVLEMIEGTRKYAIYCKIEGTEPQFVKQASTFYGPGEHFTADWTPRKQQRRVLPERRDLQAQQDAANAEAKRRLFGDAPLAPEFPEWSVIDAT